MLNAVRDGSIKWRAMHGRENSARTRISRKCAISSLAVCALRESFLPGTVNKKYPRNLDPCVVHTLSFYESIIASCRLDIGT